MSNKSKITFVVPENLQHELRQQVIKEGYGLRGKSLWVSEAIEKLFEINDYPSLVSLGDEMGGFGKTETVVIEYKLKISLESAIVTIRKQFPTLEGVKSRIVRTAILQRLLRTSKSK